MQKLVKFSLFPASTEIPYTDLHMCVRVLGCLDRDTDQTNNISATQYFIYSYKIDLYLRQYALSFKARWHYLRVHKITMKNVTAEATDC